MKQTISRVNQSDFDWILNNVEECIKQYTHFCEPRGDYALGTLHFLLAAIVAKVFTKEQQRQFDRIFKMYQFCQWGKGTYEEWCANQAQQEESNI
jgi:hypothetical protein